MGKTVKDAIEYLSKLDPAMELAVYVAETGSLTASSAQVAGFTVEPATDSHTPRWLQHPTRLIVDYDPEK